MPYQIGLKVKNPTLPANMVMPPIYLGALPLDYSIKKGGGDFASTANIRGIGDGNLSVVTKSDGSLYGKRRGTRTGKRNKRTATRKTVSTPIPTDKLPKRRSGTRRTSRTRKATRPRGSNGRFKKKA